MSRTRSSNVGVLPWLLVGLGNPGFAYARTRHNVGAWFLETLRAQEEFPEFALRKRANALVSTKKYGVRSSTFGVILVFPQTFMNESGRAVASLVRQQRIAFDHLLVIHDDHDLLFGTFKLQRNRGSAGHRGVKSVIDALGSKNFWRLRIGIGTARHEVPTERYVLMTFRSEEQQALLNTVFPESTRVMFSALFRSHS